MLSLVFSWASVKFSALCHNWKQSYWVPCLPYWCTQSGTLHTLHIKLVWRYFESPFVHRPHFSYSLLISNGLGFRPKLLLEAKKSKKEWQQNINSGQQLNVMHSNCNISWSKYTHGKDKISRDAWCRDLSNGLGFRPKLLLEAKKSKKERQQNVNSGQQLNVMNSNCNISWSECIHDRDKISRDVRWRDLSNGPSFRPKLLLEAQKSKKLCFGGGHSVVVIICVLLCRWWWWGTYLLNWHTLACICTVMWDDIQWWWFF